MRGWRPKALARLIGLAVARMGEARVPGPDFKLGICNVSKLSTAVPAIMAMDFDALSVQEHCEKEASINTIKGVMGSRGLDIEAGPVDEQAAQLGAGVATITKRPAAAMSMMMTEELEEFWKVGRVQKVVLDVGMGEAWLVYNTYGWANADRIPEARTNAKA